MTVSLAATLLGDARHAVAFTGAGISTESGIPDFRSRGGVWAGVDPFKVASRSAFNRDPGAFYDFYSRRLSTLSAAAPNRAHLAMAEMERRGVLRAVLTQNIDGLHQAAGSVSVVELHGNLRESRCSSCGRVDTIEPIRSALAGGSLPSCERCAGLLSPNVVLFEDPLPERALADAKRAARSSDVMLAVGSSLLVTPACYLLDEALGSGGRLIIVNREPTPYDPLAAVVLRGEAGAVLRQIVSELRLAPRMGEDASPPAPN